MMLTKQSGCKINLLLNILGKRSDGFHELETLMQPVPLHDELTFEATGNAISLTTNNRNLPCDDSNLVMKAARAFLKAAGVAGGVRIHLDKWVPMEAGLGGGSANAATTLLALNELFGNPLHHSVLKGLAATLGSDVPFFLQSGPALATGRGEKIGSLEPFSTLENSSLVLVHPGFGISTSWSYQSLANFPESLNGTPGRADALIHSLQTGSGDWGALLYNSLEAPAFWKHPVIELYVRHFQQHGADAALMSGSGSTVFGYFSSRRRGEVALESFHSKFGDTGWSTLLDV